MIAPRTPPAIRLGLEKNTGAIVNAQRQTSRGRTLFAVIIAGIIQLNGLTGCGGPRSDIMGQWRGAGEANTMIWEFGQNGSVKMGSTQARYSFGDRDRIKIETPSGTSVYQMELSGDRLILKDPRGSTLQFTRVK